MYIPNISLLQGKNNRILSLTFIHSNHFFSGNNSPFVSLSYNVSPRLELIAELSSDDYDMEVSTSKGLITDKEARKQNVGGEVICYVD